MEDTAIVAATGNAITGKASGTTRVRASMIEATVSLGETARVVVTAAPAGSPAHSVNTPGTSFSPATVDITVGDSVTWLFLGAVHNVTIVPGGPIPMDGSIPATPGLFFNPDDIRITPGTTVTWQISGATHTITFETIAPPGGNIEATAPGNSVSRTFTQSGEYKYFCSTHGFDGKVRVE